MPEAPIQIAFQHVRRRYVRQKHYYRMSGRGYVDPNFPNPGHPNDTDIIIYGYTPSLALACTAAAFFGVMFVASAVTAGVLSVPCAHGSIFALTPAGRMVCALSLGHEVQHFIIQIFNMQQSHMPFAIPCHVTMRHWHPSPDERCTPDNLPSMEDCCLGSRICFVKPRRSI